MPKTIMTVDDSADPAIQFVGTRTKTRFFGSTLQASQIFVIAASVGSVEVSKTRTATSEVSENAIFSYNSFGLRDIALAGPEPIAKYLSALIRHPAN